MMPFNLSFRLLLRRFIPQLKEEDLDRHEGLFALRHQLHHELNYEPKSGKGIPAYKKRIEDLIKDSTQNSERIFKDHTLYEAAYDKWISRRQVALEQGNLQQIPPSLDGLGRFGKAYFNYRWVQVRTAPRLYGNRIKYHFRKNKLASAIAVAVVAALIGTSVDAVLAGLQPPKIIEIIGQVIQEGQKFLEIDLGNHVKDRNHLDSEINWSTSGEKDLKVKITNGDRRRADILIPDQEWNSSETILFKATDPIGLSDSDTATFTVEPVNDAAGFSAKQNFILTVLPGR